MKKNLGITLVCVFLFCILIIYILNSGFFVFIKNTKDLEKYFACCIEEKNIDNIYIVRQSESSYLCVVTNFPEEDFENNTKYFSRWSSNHTYSEDDNSLYYRYAGLYFDEIRKKYSELDIYSTEDIKAVGLGRNEHRINKIIYTTAMPYDIMWLSVEKEGQKKVILIADFPCQVVSTLTIGT